VICFGARAGKQQTFALLDEWIPEAKLLERDAALAELAQRYFTSHGPATLQDFAWWSGLTMADARAGLEMIKARLQQETLAGQTYWHASSSPVVPVVEDKSPSAYLLPTYDEYTVAYKDRSAVLDPSYAKQSGNGNLHSGDCCRWSSRGCLEAHAQEQHSCYHAELLHQAKHGPNARRRCCR
jgi:hypothetical protein